jgi:hypothetical protein
MLWRTCTELVSAMLMFGMHGGHGNQNEDLPYVTEAEARQLIADLGEVLTQFGYRPKATRPDKNTAGNGRDASDWAWLVENIIQGRELHDSTRDLAGGWSRAECPKVPWSKARPVIAGSGLS